MKIVVQIQKDDNGELNRVYFCFDEAGMNKLKEILNSTNFNKDGDHLHLFSEEWGISKDWCTPALSSEEYI